MRQLQVRDDLPCQLIFLALFRLILSPVHSFGQRKPEDGSIRTGRIACQTAAYDSYSCSQTFDGEELRQNILYG